MAGHTGHSKFLIGHTGCMSSVVLVKPRTEPEQGERMRLVVIVSHLANSFQYDSTLIMVSHVIQVTQNCTV